MSRELAERYLEALKATTKAVVLAEAAASALAEACERDGDRAGLTIYATALLVYRGARTVAAATCDPETVALLEKHIGECADHADAVVAKVQKPGKDG